MLKLIWDPTFTGAPDSDSFRVASDSLFLNSVSGQLLQRFRKPDPYQKGKVEPDLAKALGTWCRNKKTKRVVVMVHGYNYDPTGTIDKAGDPFNLCYGVPGHMDGNDHRLSWLPIVGETNETGDAVDDIALAFAWMSDATFTDYSKACWGSHYQLSALDVVPMAAKALATVLWWLCSQDIQVDILAHSLGTRLVCQAMKLLEPGVDDKSIRRVILMGGAEFTVDANAHLYGRSFDIFNLANRHDTVLTLGAQTACHPYRANGSNAARVIGRGGLRTGSRWMDMQLDRKAAQDWLLAKSYTVSGVRDNDVHEQGWLHHWVYYANDNNRHFVKALLNDSTMTGDWFRQGGFPEGIDCEQYGEFDPTIPETPQTCQERLNAGHETRPE